MSKGTIVSGGTDGDYDVSVELVDGSNQTMQAHCADLTEDLTGEVGVLEIAGDLDKGRNIQPGYDSNAVYDATRDGQMLEVLSKKTNASSKSQHSAGIFWNWAMRAGWQKWRPNYRYGTISNLSGDTCDVALDACVSTDTPDGQELDCNQASSLSGVSIEYMDCNGSAFADGDEVIVKFEDNDWSKPKVIGFKSDPKSCYWESWGDGICGNHQWEVWYAGDPYHYEMCPSLPFTSDMWTWHGVSGSYSINIIDGVWTATYNGSADAYRSFDIDTSYWHSDNPDDDPITPTKMIIKWNNSGSGSRKIEIELSGSGGHAHLVGAFNPVYPLSGGDTFVGFNEGNEMEIDLTGTDFSGTLLGVYIAINIYKESVSGVCTIDYINFTS